MADGEHQLLTGILRASPEGFLTLEVTGGGVWRLDTGWGSRARRLIGRHVAVEGRRAGFDLIDVKRIREAPGPPDTPSPPPVTRQC